MTIYCDIDGTLTDKPRGGGQPVEHRIARIKQLIDEGNEVILWSAGGEDGARKFAAEHGIKAKYFLTKPHVVIDDNPKIRPHGWKFYKPEEYFGK